jgi:hypothetical protein
MAKLVCTDHEDLYKNMLKPRMKVGNDFVTQVRVKDQLTILMQLSTYCQMYKIAPSSFRFMA